MDRFDTMQAFLRVVELHSFTKAAQSLNLPKATVSAQVQALEKHLNVKLLHRTTRNISITKEGAAYYERARQLLHDLEETESAVSLSSHSFRGRLRIETSGTLGRQIIIPALDDFFRRYPEIDLEIGCSDRTVDLLQDGVDCAIRGGMPLDDTLVARKLIDTQPITCATQAYLDRHGTPQTLEELEQHTVVNYLSPRTGRVVGFSYMRGGEKVTIFGRRRVTINDIDGCLAAAIANLGIVQMPYFGVREHIKAGRLVRIMSQYPAERLPIYIVYLPNRHLSANVRAFVDWMVELFQQKELTNSDLNTDMV